MRYPVYLVILSKYYFFSVGGVHIQAFHTVFDYLALAQVSNIDLDHLALAQAFHTVFVRGVPDLDPDQPEAARFVNLIDVLYVDMSHVIHTRTHARTHARTRTHTHTHTHTHAQMHARAHTQTQNHHTITHKHPISCTRTYTQTHPPQ